MTSDSAPSPTPRSSSAGSALSDHAAIGNLIVVAAPSGAGKTSLVSATLAAMPSVQLSVSHTTRSMRPGEIDGEDYHFTDTADFQQLIDEDGFVEYAEVFGNYYGTSKMALQQPLASGHDVILEIDWQGALLIKRAFPDAIRVFILPPSIEALRERLENRGQDSEAVIKKRMTEARDQISHYREFDYIIVNDDFDKALGELKGLISASRLRISAQQRRYQSLIASLLAED